MDVPVPDVEDDGTEPKENRDQQREHDDDLTALAGGCGAGHGHAAVDEKAVGVHSIRIVASAPSLIVPIPRSGTSLKGVLRETFTGSPLRHCRTGT